jgi:hypothetical protein
VGPPGWHLSGNPTYRSSTDKMGLHNCIFSEVCDACSLGSDRTTSMKIPDLGQFCRAALLVLVFSLAGFGQAAQVSPELCGKRIERILMFY